MTIPNYALRGLVAAGAVAAVVAAPSCATAKDLFEGKTVKVIIGLAPGGGYDAYGRLVARHIGKYLPGKPSVIAQNMPGAGSLLAANYIYNKAPKDGTEFGTFARNLPLLGFSGESKQVHFDPLKFTWIGSPTSYAHDAYLMAVRKDTGVKTIADLQHRKKPLNFASTSFGSTGTDVPLVLRATLGINVQVVHGYPGGSSLYLAVDRGEMDGRMMGYSSVKSSHPQWLKEGSPVRIILQFARETRHPDFPNVPTAREIARTQADRDLIEMMETPYFMARPFAAPPGLSAEVTKALRDAFMEEQSDPAYLKEAKTLRIDISPRDGARVQKLVERMSDIPRELYARYSEILAHPKAARARVVNWQKVSGKIVEIDKKGRVTFEADGKQLKARARKGYTKVKVGGKAAKADAIKKGMTCNIWYEGNKSTAGRVECEG